MTAITNIIRNIICLINKNICGSYLLPAHECGGARATINYNSLVRKKSGEVRKQAGKKNVRRKNEFLLACQSGGRRTMRWDSISAILR